MPNHTLRHTKHGANPIVQLENDYASLTISLFGGHILSFKPKHDERERLWVSESAIFDAKTPIRGGIPVCWPWFGPATSPYNKLKPAPSHGYVRNCMWLLDSCEEKEGGTQLVLHPDITEPYSSNVHLSVKLIVLVKETLTVTLETTNTGEPVPFFAALHSYFSVSHIEAIKLGGVEGDYIDKLDNGEMKSSPTPYQISAETDRVHLGNTMDIIKLIDNTETEIASSGYDSIVVWNPWIDKSAGMADMSPTGFTQMVCIETARTQPNVLDHGAVHALTQVIK